MLISHRYKFILLSRYKCASTTIRALFKDYADITGSQEYPYYYHTPLAPLKEHFREKNWPWEKYFIFTSMRNPWELLASLYAYGLPGSDYTYWWERHWEEVRREHYHPGQRAVPGDMPEFSEWVLNADFKRFKLEPFINNSAGQREAHYIARVERMDCDLFRVAQKIGVSINKVPRLNPTAGRTSKVRFSKAASNRVRREFATDIFLGGYVPPEGLT